MLFGKYVNKYYLKYIIPFIIGIAALIIIDFYQLKIPEIIGNIIDSLEQKTLNKTTLKEYMIDILLIAGIMFVGRFTWRICIFGNGIRIETDIRNEMFIHTEKLSQEFLQENKTGALMALYTNDLQTVRRAVGSGTIMLIDALFLGVLAFIKMWNMDKMLTLVSSIPLLLLAVCGGIIGKVLRKKSMANHKAYADLSDFAQESFSGISVVKAFVKEAKELIQFSKYNKKNMDTTLDMVKTGTIVSILLSIIISSISLIIIGYGGYLVYAYKVGLQDKIFSIGDLTKFTSFFGTLTWPMMAIAQLINMRSQGGAALKRISNLLDEKININNDLVTNEVYELPFKGNIEYRNLNFTYPKTDLEVLHNVNINISSGEMVGIIGRTGSGKTTLVDLLLRIYNIEEGTLFIDGIDIMHLPLNVVRDAIAYVPQDNFLFSDTIENNINFSKDNTDKEQIKKAAILSDVDENIEEFTHKYDTILGERGVTVSGGQKQRISIARALMKDAPILILDDSVSAVDTKTEEKIIHNLRKERAGKTTILIAHRITTISQMDKIIVIEDGKITGIGSHEELLQNNELYKRQVKLQELEEEVSGS